jgi:hypothetical protein
MAFKAKASKERVGIQTGFAKGKITNKPSISEEKFGYALNLTFESPQLPFPIEDKVFFDDNTSWKLDLVMQAGDCKPIGVTENDAGDKVNEWEETHLENKDIQVLVYQHQYINIFDYIPADATDEVKAGVMKRFTIWENKKLKGGQGTNAVKKDEDVPF